ncbi:Ubiquitin-associated and SH3 domain-containing protein [Trichinella pseudospiralis]
MPQLKSYLYILAFEREVLRFFTFSMDNQVEKLFLAIGAAESVKDIYKDADWLPGIEEKKGTFGSISRLMSKVKNESIRVQENSVCQIGNANLPQTLMWRRGEKTAWLADPPLTTVGCNTAKLYAEAPNFRCVQTADIILKVADPGGKIKIRIEPGLEADLQPVDKNLCWYIKPEQFTAHNIHRVDATYKSKTRIKNFPQRNEILDEIHENHVGNMALLIVSDWNINELCNAICNCKISSENNAVFVKRDKLAHQVVCAAFELALNRGKTAATPVRRFLVTPDTFRGKSFLEDFADDSSTMLELRQKAPCN